MVDHLSVQLKALRLKNPVMTASGTFGYGEEYLDFMDVSRIGGIIVKGTTIRPREGNDYPRMAETASGMLNAVGLQNKGVHYFVKHLYPRICDFNTNVLVNVSGSTVDDYVQAAEIIQELDKIPGIELNVSCPNVKEGGMAFGVSPRALSLVVKEVRAVYKKHLMLKLSPNVTDITELAKIAEDLIREMNWDRNVKQQSRQQTLFPLLDGAMQEVFDLFAEGRDYDTSELYELLRQKRDCDMGYLLSILLQLELYCLIRALPGNKYRLY
jgi:hypothetical protein